MNKLESIIGDYESFLSDITSEIEDEGFDLSDFSMIDHLCYRVETTEQYQQKKQECVSAIGELLTETMVNGRPISTIRLKPPILFNNWRIDALELPAPKQGRVEVEGLEHIEMVLFDSIEDFLTKYKDKNFELRSADRGINPEVGYKLPSGKGVKFHLLPLTTVVYLEGELGIDEVND